MSKLLKIIIMSFTAIVITLVAYVIIQDKETNYVEVKLSDIDTQSINEASTKSETIEYLFSSINSNNIDGFYNSFEQSALTSDLFKYNILDKYKVAETFISKISRGRKIEAVFYEPDIKGLNVKHNNFMKVLIIYSDNIEVPLKLKMDTFRMESYHSDQKPKKIYVVATSPLEMIDQIERIIYEEKEKR